MINSATVTQAYLMGIREGRECLAKNGTVEISIQDRISNLKSTIKGFSAGSDVGQMLRGELDFWRNQQKICERLTAPAHARRAGHRHHIKEKE